MSIERHLSQTDNQKKAASPAAQPAAAGEFFSPVDKSYQHVMFLQRTVGNQAVQQLMHQRRTPTLQREAAPAQEPKSEPRPIQQIPDMEIEFKPNAQPVVDHGRVVRLEGLTEADFEHSQVTAKTVGTKGVPATGCDGCSDDDPCAQFTATLVTTYSVPITVTLPDLNSMGLTECEYKQAKKWVDTVLKPHEQKHVKAYETYNGTTSRPVTIKCCNSQGPTKMKEKIDEMVDKEQKARQAAAETKSKALDPFNMDFTFDCPDEEKQSETENPAAEMADPVE